MSNKNLFTAKDACDHLGIYFGAWKGVVEQHNIPFEMVGGRPIFTRAAIEQAKPYVDAHINRPRITRRPVAATA